MPATRDPITGRLSSVDPMARFEEQIDRSSGYCHEWTGRATTAGYGQIWVNGREVLVHRFAHEMFIGPIPEGLDVDHLCKNRMCANPDHLEAVTRRENLIRSTNFIALNAAKTHCLRGHPLSGSNLYLYRGKRHCRACRTIHTRKQVK